MVAKQFGPPLFHFCTGSGPRSAASCTRFDTACAAGSWCPGDGHRHTCFDEMDQASTGLANQTTKAQVVSDVDRGIFYVAGSAHQHVGCGRTEYIRREGFDESSPQPRAYNKRSMEFKSQPKRQQYPKAYRADERDDDESSGGDTNGHGWD